MNETGNSFPSRVVFKPERDDFVYLSRAISSTAGRYSKSAHYLFNIFLLINAIFVPGFLIFLGYWAVGLTIFIADIASVVFIVPTSQKRADVDFLNRFYDDIGEQKFEVELTSGGIRSVCDGCETFLSWKHITAVQESTEAIYFFSRSRGIPVRKSAFASDRECRAFADYARNSARSARQKQLEPKPFSSITD